ncbi:MAG TPA: PDZ domain-containing protein, partial [Planctomycetota bacterium]|nr:PDZ domain-containing protein [Planctomycetota bacterium]
MISYHVDLSRAASHQVAVRMSVPAGGALALDVALPVWTPGSYLVREFARHVLELQATDGQGRRLRTDKLDKNTWRVETSGAEVVVIDYLLYANERSVRTNHADDGHAFLSPAATFCFVRGRQQEPHRITVAASAGWQVFTALSPDQGGWLASDYDTLVDSPIEVGPHRVLEYEQQGVPFRIVLAGEAELDEVRLQEDTADVTESVARIFGSLPFDRYLFIFELVDDSGGGLEHADSSVCMVNRWSLARPAEYRKFLGLVAHEFFHAWNVKRFRPAALGPFDYDRENYTGDLWVAEGITSYLDDLSVLRAGLFEKTEDYLNERAKAFQELSELPGARRMSLEHASRDTWIKYYWFDENSGNASVSYYSKGALVALLLDLRIARLTGGERGLQDVLRLGWQRYTEAGQGYPEGALEALASEVAGQDLSAFFAEAVRGTATLDPAADLAHVGLRLAVEPEKSERELVRDEQGFLLAPTLGVTTADEGGLCKVSTVLEDGAGHEAGLSADDIILAVDDMRVSAGTLQDRLDRTGGDAVTLTVWRGQSLRRLDAAPRLKRLEQWKLLPVGEPTAAQQAAFRAWTGQPLPEPAAP